MLFSLLFLGFIIYFIAKRIEDKNVYGPAGYKAVKKIGVVENKMKRQHKYNSVMGLRADAYTAKANNFGVKKPKVNIK